MNKKLMVIITSGVCIINGCCAAAIKGDGNVIAQERTAADFERIKMAAPANVKVHLGAQPRVVVRTDANLMEHLETSVDGGALSIKVKDKGMGGIAFTKLEVEVYAKTLAGVSVAGSGDVVVVDEIVAKSFEASVAGSGTLQGRARIAGALESKIAGSGDVRLSGSAESLDISVSGSGNFACTNCEIQRASVSIAGSGDVSLQGKSRELRVSIMGSGDFRGGDLEAQTADVKIAGSGDAKVWAAEKLNVSIAGSGDVTYKGSPQLTSSIRGSGDLRHTM